MTDRRVIVTIACLLLALATAVAATSPGIERRDTTTVSDREAPAAPDRGTATDRTGELPTPGDPAGDRDQGSFRLTLTGVISGLLLLAAAVLALAIAARLRLVLRRHRRRDDTGLRGPPGVLLDDDGPHTEELASVVDDQLDAIAQGPPRNAIVAAWVALELAAERAGVPRYPADTSTDLAARTLTAQGVDRTALERLAALYREARFSPHELTEHHRTSARECLEQLRVQLRGVAR